MTDPNPSLAICIPTYERPEALAQLLNVLIPQCKLHSVAIYVSDNASSPAVARVVHESQKTYRHLFYRRNETNVGMAANFVAVVDLSQALFTWLFSDDDLPTDDAVSSMLALCERDGAEDLIIANRRLMTDDLTEDQFRCLESLNEDLIMVGGGGLLSRACLDHYTYITCLCFRTSLWKTVGPVRFADIAYFAHTSIVASFMADSSRQARITAKPLILWRVGKFSWAKETGAVWFHFFPMCLARSEGYTNVERRRCLWSGWLGPYQFCLWQICKSNTRLKSLRAVWAARREYVDLGDPVLWCVNVAAICCTLLTPEPVWLCARTVYRCLLWLRCRLSLITNVRIA